jgi:hypothetical protein
MRFGHVTYLEGQSNTLFTNDNSTQLLWTQVVPDWQNTGSKRGVLFDYSLQALASSATATSTLAVRLTYVARAGASHACAR